jgi:YhcH/YjgK/YiaL family protein
MAIIGSIVTAKAQSHPASVFAPCFGYLDDLFRPDSSAARRLRGIAIGETQKIELGGGAFVLEQVYRTKSRSEGFFESHRKYIDVQVVFEGEEWMELADLSRCVGKHPYEAQRDLLVYNDVSGSRLLVAEGDAAIFFPTDVHMPGLCAANGPAVVRKTVVKVPMGSW